MFLCVGNSCRSQIAEGFPRYYGKGIIEAHCAGPQQQSQRQLVMKEKGIDISLQKPELLDPSTLKDYEILISMACPVVYLKDFIDGSHLPTCGKIQAGMRSKGWCWNC